MNMRALNSGFTLIEVMIYLALYSMLFTGAISGVYALSASAARDRTAAMIDEEGSFLLAKTEWILSDASQIDVPLTEGPELVVTDSDGTVVHVGISGGDIYLRTNSAESETLSNTDVTIHDLIFARSGSSTQPLTESFMLSATTSDGQVLARDFTTTVFLRQSI
jgi:prepilin-type N-terminal cleavage/methylation domain-containing protein